MSNKMKTFKEFNEQIAMSVGGGAVAGMPTASPPEQTPVAPGVKTSMLRRKKPVPAGMLSRGK